MNAVSQTKRTLQVGLLSLIATALLALLFYTPVWWVSLTAPNYPEEAFPDGVRIHFHMNGVFNGCRKVEKEEIREEIALDCVHEMDTINHYVGMYPIAAGGVVERAFSPFLVSILGVMLIGFACSRPRPRMLIMGLAFAGISGWMYLTFYTEGGLAYHDGGYVEALVTALDQEAGAEESRELDAGQALIARLKASLAASGEEASEPEADAAAGKSEKQRLIDNLRVTFRKDQERRPQAERLEWEGSASQILGWHYEKSLGRYFNNPQEIRPMVAKMTFAGHAVFWGLIAAMCLLVYGARRNGGPLYWLMVLVPLALPLFFIIDYSAWLWWYGHSLNQMGAFTVKPFMPTVFGDGKVAQFATHSYPYKGFGLMLASSLLLAVAALIRRKQFRNEHE
ncbi:MAG: hypothetical protein B0D96_13330 [Candidatus Sedimenticola endophacoides]|uniref:Cytochrome C n=1 Tax=Candidatus Sedimenticola endophacoides TaxID=2548426 RepID=A0A657PTP1_9GAMM|nr:MAG: hypothetical protein B0D94_00520 [Candidatus Sedimenticola endophacoides]OQX32642.1 MAG: hypothetical protein B0D96_13330 [Candidatus Sedimenticola endophacoides]OQX42838.1 MAG: hypothetical protein B0D89_00455 [Candidatus Sedimenticola endophacoides]OQX44174.1 MAG: hypothetical protein B0D88_03030 [Candidatus Sedimenticola endophacoides]OQX46341.1 MAG: hypothetical protein B0D86_01870 [Candidatus Sedimenticola endophacoides]